MSDTETFIDYAEGGPVCPGDAKRHCRLSRGHLGAHNPETRATFDCVACGAKKGDYHRPLSWQIPAFDTLCQVAATSNWEPDDFGVWLEKSHKGYGPNEWGPEKAKSDRRDRRTTGEIL